MKKLVLLLAVIIGIIPAIILLAIGVIAGIVVFGRVILIGLLVWIIYRVFFKKKVIQIRIKK